LGAVFLFGNSPLSTPNTSFKKRPPFPPTHKKKKGRTLHFMKRLLIGCIEILFINEFFAMDSFHLCPKNNNNNNKIIFIKLACHYFWPGLIALPKNTLPTYWVHTSFLGGPIPCIVGFIWKCMPILKRLEMHQRYIGCVPKNKIQVNRTCLFEKLRFCNL
jgi:hypothetical protein